MHGRGWTRCIGAGARDKLMRGALVASKAGQDACRALGALRALCGSARSVIRECVVGATELGARAGVWLGAWPADLVVQVPA